MTAARALRKSRRGAQSPSVATQHQPRDRLDARVCWTNAPLAVAVYPSERGRESATDSAMCGGTGNQTARITGFGEFPQIAMRRARVPADPDSPSRSPRDPPACRHRDADSICRTAGSWGLWDVDSGGTGHVTRPVASGAAAPPRRGATRRRIGLAACVARPATRATDWTVVDRSVTSGRLAHKRTLNGTLPPRLALLLLPRRGTDNRRSPPTERLVMMSA